MTWPRSLAIDTVDHGTVVVPEPRWCTGHGWQVTPYLADVTHYSVPVKAAAMTEGHGLVEVMRARISHAPYAVKQPEPYPVVSVSADIHLDLDPAEARQVARALRVAALRLEQIAVEAARLRGGEGR
ncbi:hypothetical protein MBT84_19865 [Streptomyces sp. MBT84]|uniref:DUF6907 domain-containing protein n=1 Tax=Streptomyces sp. MBT84 TaxID=1488414 RepID=UPI001C6F2F02|nr:hypothetical protein [Streptomyces sp. MBT84]MBW8701867.1 hypothetical protein [Streptomyces sp. MBT84]